MSPSFPSSEHTSYSIRLLPSLSSASAPPRSSSPSRGAAASSLEDPDPGETWSGPSFRDLPEPEPEPAAPLAPPLQPSAFSSAAPPHALPLIRRPSAIPPPFPMLRQRAKAPAPELLAPLPIVVDPQRAGGRFLPTPARIAAVVCGALVLVVVTASVSYLFFRYLFGLL
jgi:hypothetical protein